MTPLRLVMMGTGEFALPSFEILYQTGHTVVGLITQPDRIAPGRRREHDNPLKRLALSRETPVLQPASINTSEGVESLIQLRPDVLVVAAYGQILSPEVLRTPRLAAINVHASLLPRHRGASPVAHAIWMGDSVTGVSIIQILPALDAGPVLSTAVTPIGPTETAGELEDRLAHLGAALLPDVLRDLQAGTARGVAQDPTLVTRCPKLRKEQGQIDWTLSPARIDCHVRAMQPWPGPSSHLIDNSLPPQRLIVLAVRGVNDLVDAPIGQVVPDSEGRFLVQAGGGQVELLRVQPPGKKPMSASDFLRGHPLGPHARLGVDPTV
ncbi:MAG: methionyl-tRNA formyltransferase [Planctomycetaceae bacterium]